MRRVRGAPGKVSVIVTKEDTALLRDWKSFGLGDIALLEAPNKQLPPPGGVERPG